MESNPCRTRITSSMEVHSFPYSLPVSNQTIALRTAFNTLSRLRDLKEA